MLEKLSPRRAFLLCTLIILLVLSVLALQQLPSLISADLPNPDSFYKLVLVREYSPATGFQYMARDNAPYGTYQHWSAVHSWSVWQLSHSLQALGMAEHAALIAAGAGMTALSMLVLTLAVARVVLNQGSPLAAVVTVIALVSCGPLRGYGQPVQISHHIFMLVPLALAAIVLLPSAQARRGWYGQALIAGGLLALALWISPETMPLIAVLLAVRAALRIQAPANEPVWPIAVGLCAMLAVAWWLDPPPPTFSAWALDHISLAWLSFGGLLAVLLLLTDLLVRSRLPVWRISCGMAGAAVVAALIWLTVVPGALRGPAGLIPPELKTLWWDHIDELRPVSSASEAIVFLGMPLTAGLLMVVFAHRQRALWMLVLAVSTLVYGAMAAQHTRMGAAAGLVAMLSYGVALSRIEAFRAPRTLRGRPLASLTAFVLILLPSLQLTAAYLLLDDQFLEMKKNTLASRCKVTDIAPVLNALPPGTVLSSINDTPEVLWRTHHRTIAGNYHHNIPGLLDHFYVWRSTAPDERARRLVEQRKIDYILGCDIVPNEMKRNGGQPTLASRVAAGEVIDWLAAHEKIGHWQLYRTKP